MTQPQVDYDRIAPGYDRRYAIAGPHGRIEALLLLAGALKARRILEVGCGTGYWLEQLRRSRTELYGLDPSMGMLRRAKARKTSMHLSRGLAGCLPFREHAFDLLFCIQAIHHFSRPRSFVKQAYRVLGCGGVLAIIGSDPRHADDKWYIYDYFEGTLETDLKRKPSWQTLSAWLEEAGFEGIELTIVEQVSDPKQGRDVLDDPFLRKSGCSQLALLSAKAYAAGLARLEADLVAAEAQQKDLVFSCHISIAMLTGRRPLNRCSWPGAMDCRQASPGTVSGCSPP